MTGTSLTLPAAAAPDRAAWVARIEDAYWRALDRTLEVGRQLLAAKAALPRGEFQAMVASQLPFGARWAQKFMAVAADPRLANTKHASLLPASTETLYEVSRLDDALFEEALADGRINAGMSRSDVARIRRESLAEAAADESAGFEGCTVDDLEALALEGRTFGAILADPPWQYETWSDGGKDRSADAHYPTMTVDEIAALPVRDLAADDCVLGLWATGPMLMAALEVIPAWGFRYSTLGWVWIKQNPAAGGLWRGNGHWTGANAELVLLCTRGSPKRLHADVEQVITAPWRGHSVKPAEIHGRVERLARGPYLELFARRGVERWTVWGNEIGKADMEGTDQS